MVLLGQFDRVPTTTYRSGDPREAPTAWIRSQRELLEKLATRPHYPDVRISTICGHIASAGDDGWGHHLNARLGPKEAVTTGGHLTTQDVAHLPGGARPTRKGAAVVFPGEGPRGAWLRALVGHTAVPQARDPE